MEVFALVVCVVVTSSWLSDAAPLKLQLVDLTYPFDGRANRFPVFRNFSMQVVMNGTLGDTDVWLQSDEYASSTHAGTHMDAQSHFIPGGASIDQVPLRQFFGAAAVIDISERAANDPDAEVTTDDLIRWEESTGGSLDDAIVFMRSGWGSRYYNRTAYYGTATNDPSQMKFPGFSPAAALWLVDNRKIKGAGVDTLSLDRGSTVEFWAHRFFLRNGVFVLENVANLEDIPVYGATVYVMPMKIAGASGAPTRIVATYPELIFRR